MRFTVAWAHVISENQALKIALACLSTVLLGLCVVAIKLSNKKPLLIERSCFSRAIIGTEGGRSTDEIEVFVREALAMRFDTLGRVKPGYLSEEELKFRAQEQVELKKRDLAERILVNSVTVSGDKAVVDADRVFSVGAIRSALSFPLTLTLGSVARNEWNPYGLILLQVATLIPTGQVPASQTAQQGTPAQNRVGK